MQFKEAISIIKRSQTDQELRKTEDYVSAHFTLGSFSKMTVDVGPYCNLECPPCYAECSPANDFVRSEHLNDRIIEEALENGFDSIRLTDGEPMVARHMELIRKLCSVNDSLKTIIISNGVFGLTDIMDKPLSDIMGEIVKDPLFWVHKLGSVGFSYWLAREDEPGLSLSGYDECGVCRQIFQDKSFIQNLRKRFGSNPETFKPLIAEKYLEFANQKYKNNR